LRQQASNGRIEKGCIIRDETGVVKEETHIERAAL
jgi:hypothetical protein